MYHLQLSNGILSLSRVLDKSLRPVLPDSSLEDILSVNLESSAELSCKTSDAILNLDAGCNANSASWTGTVTRSKVPGFGETENGFCVKSNGEDENIGVIKLSSENVETNAKVDKCWSLCKNYNGGIGVTGCEAIWNQQNRGCYVHTSPNITHGNGKTNHFCALYDNGLDYTQVVSAAGTHNDLSAPPNDFSLDMQDATFFQEEGGYYHFDNLVKRIPFVSLSPSKNPEISIEIYFRLHRYANNRGWIISSDDIRGGYDRGIALHDHRFGNRPAGIPGYLYPNSTLQQIPLGKWVHIVATFHSSKHRSAGHICMSVVESNNAAKIYTTCHEYTPKNLDGLMKGFDLGGSSVRGRHTVDADIAILRVYDHALEKSDIETKFKEILSVRGGAIIRQQSSLPVSDKVDSSQPDALLSASGIYSMQIASSLGNPSFIEGCFGTIDADEDVPFNIEPHTGQIILKPDASLNFEERKQYGLQIRLVDSGGISQSISVQGTLTSKIKKSVSITESNGLPLDSTHVVIIDIIDVNEAPTIISRCTHDQLISTLTHSIISLRPLAASHALPAHRKRQSGLYYLVADKTNLLSPRLALAMGLPNRHTRSANTFKRFAEGGSFKLMPGLWDARGVTIAEYTTSNNQASNRNLCRDRDGGVYFKPAPHKMSASEDGRRYMRDCTWIMVNGLDTSSIISENDFASMNNLKSFQSISLDEDSKATYLSIGHDNNDEVTWNSNDGGTAEMRAVATFYIDSPLIKPDSYSLSTHAWMWSLGTPNHETRKCDLTWWVMTKKNNALTSLWRNEQFCQNINCIEEATSAFGVDHGNCLDIEWKTNGETVCPNGYYISGFLTKNQKSTGAFEKIRCCRDINVPQSKSAQWKSCYVSDWSLSFSQKGWSGCYDADQTHLQDGIFKLSGLTTTCANDIKCISKAKCCTPLDTSSDPVSVQGAREMSIPLDSQGDSWNSFNNIFGMRNIRYIRVSISLNEAAISSFESTPSWIKLPEMEFYGSASSLSDFNSIGSNTILFKSGSAPWEPSILWESGSFKKGRRPQSEDDMIKFVENSDFSARGYCSRSIPKLSLISNQQCPSGAHDNIAYRVTVRFSLNMASEISFRFGVDFGFGGLVLLDGNLMKSNYGNIWWGLKWSHQHTEMLTISNVKLERGNHELMIYGLENCCDGPQTYQFKIRDLEDPDSDAAWQDISVESLEPYAGSSIPGTDDDPGANGRLSYRLGTKYVVPFLCAEREGAVCKDCKGKIYYGRKFVNGRPGIGEKTTLTQLRTSNYAMQISDGTPVACSDGAFGDPLPGVHKYCYCEFSESQRESNQKLPFVVDSISGQIMLSGELNSLDYESTKVHTFSVTATDGGGMEASTQVTVNVLDVNEPPSFPSPELKFSISEASSPGIKIGQVAATDPDKGQSLSYSIVHLGSGIGEAFSISECDGTILVGNQIDFESQKIYKFEVIATDNGTPQARSASILVTINVLDVNEPPKCFAARLYVDENSMRGTIVQGFINASDPDTEDAGNLQYSAQYSFPYSVSQVTETQIPFAFTDSGNVIVDGDLDYEDISEKYELTVTVKDRNGLSSNCDITILINDKNEPPMYNGNAQYSVKENSPEGTPLTGKLLSAIDPDASDFGHLKYTIVSNIPSPTDAPTMVTYVITVNTAAITGAGTVDQIQFRLFGTLQVGGTPWQTLISSTSGPISLTTGSINVFTVHDVPYVGALTAIQFKTLGDDSWIVSRVVIGRPGYMPVQINDFPDISGIISRPTALVRGTAYSPILPVQACLSMSNRKPRTSDTALHGGWRCPDGYRLPRSDEWSRVKSCANGNVKEGKIDVVTSVGGCNCDSALGNGINERLYCEHPSMETINLGRQCGDSPQLHICVRKEPLSMALVTSPNRFRIDESTGVLYVASNNLDYEDASLFKGGTRRSLLAEDRSLSLRIRVEDVEGNAAETDVKVKVLDENEAPLIVPQAPDKFIEIPENWSESMGVEQIMFSDVDENDDLSSLKIKVASGDPRNLFQVNEAGYLSLDPIAVSVLGGLDFEDTSPNTILLNIEVQDSAGLYSTEPYIIRVIDINEPPFFDARSYKRTVGENSLPGTIVDPAIMAKDQDIIDQEEGAVTYSMAAVQGYETGAQYFSLDEKTGQITVTEKGAAKLNYEDKENNMFSFHILASDSSGLSSEMGSTGHLTNISIELEDENEAPYFTETTIGIPISSKSTPGQSVGSPLNATDEDIGDYLSYTIVRQQESNDNIYTVESSSCFDVGRISGQIIVRDSSGLNSSDCLVGERVHNLEVLCVDSGNLQARINVKINIIQANRNPIIDRMRSEILTINYSTAFLPTDNIETFNNNLE